MQGPWTLSVQRSERKLNVLTLIEFSAKRGSQLMTISQDMWLQGIGLGRFRSSLETLSSQIGNDNLRSGRNTV